MKDKSIKWDGKQITKPGMYSGVPLDLYHKAEICDGPSISSSGLRKLNPDVGSPAHFYAQWDGNPNRAEDDDEKRAYVIGRAIHHLLLGEKFFAKLFVVRPPELPHYKTGELRAWHGNHIECKEWLEQQRKLGRASLSPQEVEVIKQVCISVGNAPLYKEGILSGLIERSLFWRDKETGIWLKWRPDAIPTSSADFGELKTTRSVLYPSLMQTLRAYAYYQQGALGRWGCREVLGMEMASFTFLFAEKDVPFCTRDVRLEDEDMQRGERMNRATLRIFADCMKKKRWPGPGEGNEGNERLRLSGAARERIDSILKNEGLADGQD